MTIFHVIRKTDSAMVYAYEADTPIEWVGFESAQYDHVPQAGEASVPQPLDNPADWRIYPGPFKDRLGVDGMAIAVSTHPICIAAREMLAGRLYIDLKGDKASSLLDMLIAMEQPAASPYFPGSGPMTTEKKALILGTKPTAEEVFNG